MRCLATLLALLTQRVALVLIWLFTDWLGRAYETALLPLLGFLFMPYTTLAYMAGMLADGSISGGWLVLVVVAALADLGFFSQRARTHWKHRRTGE